MISVRYICVIIFKKRNKMSPLYKLSLYIIFFCCLPLHLSAKGNPPLPIQISDIILPEKNFDVTLQLKKDDVVQGLFKFNKPIKKLLLLDSKQKPLRQLNKADALSGRFVFSVKQSSTYTIRALNATAKTRVYLLVKNIIPIEKQKFTPKVPMSIRIQNLKKELEHTNNTDSFWKKVKQKGTPLVEIMDKRDAVVTFLYKGAKHNVKLIGGPDNKAEFNQLKNSDVWYKSFKIPLDSRFSYQLAPDVPTLPGSFFERRIAILDTAQKDPLNQYPISLSKNADKYNQFSTITLPNASKQPWIKAQDVAKGKIESYALNSTILKNRRTIEVYKPSGFTQQHTYPVLFFFDGRMHQNRIPTSTILDNLIAHKQIPPSLAVFIHNPDLKTRSVELPPNERFADFMAKELLPWFHKTIGIQTKAYSNIVAGFSYGGLASSYVAFKYPQYFGAVLSQSGSFWWKPKNDKEYEWLTSQYALSKKKNLRFFLSAGLFETKSFIPGSISLLNSNRHLRNVLLAKDYDVKYEEFSGGHDFLSWRSILSNGLIHLLNPPL